MKRNSPSPESEEPATDPAPKRVLLVVDHPTFRQGLKFIVTQSGEFEVCGEADGAPVAISECRKLLPDVVVVDVSMPGINGIELIKMILAEMPEMPILVVSMHKETHYALLALKAGAKGYVMKAEAMTSIAGAMRRIAEGENLCQPDVWGAAHFQSDPSDRRRDGLARGGAVRPRARSAGKARQGAHDAGDRRELAPQSKDGENAPRPHQRKNEVQRRHVDGSIRGGLGDERSG